MTRLKCRLLGFSLALCIAFMLPAVWADSKAITLNESVPQEVRSVIQSAIAMNKKAKAVDMEWLWVRPLRKMWRGSRQDNSGILQQVIKMANAGQTEQALETARFIENAARQGLLQYEKAKQAGPTLF